MSFRSILPSFSLFSSARSARPSLTSASTSLLSSTFSPNLSLLQVRHKSLVPRKTKYRKSHKGRIPIALGGSTKGTTLEWGEYGLRVNEPCRLSAKHLESAEAALKRGLKPVRGCKVYLRVFPDIPVCIKGNETRMGKGKGTFEFWACRARIGRVIFEIGGPNLRPEIAAQVMKLAAAKLPVTTEMIDRNSPPRVGYEAADVVKFTPKIITAGEHALAMSALQASIAAIEMEKPVEVVA